MRIKLGSVGHANIYTEEFLEARFDPEDIIGFSVPAEEPNFSEKRCRSIEVFVPKGGRALYGLLGGCFVPVKKSSIDVQINVLDKAFVSYENSLAKNVDEVKVGLPREFANAVEKAIRVLSDSEDHRLNSGKLTISVAAHGAIGSSEFVYEKLMVLLNKLFSLSDREICEEDIESKIQM